METAVQRGCTEYTFSKIVREQVRPFCLVTAEIFL